MSDLRGSLEGSQNYLHTLIDTSDAITTLWLVLATALVMLMQAGFLLLEAGSMRSKSTINVAQKNVTDMIISGCVFLTFGATIMFGAGSTGFFGFGGFSFSDFSNQPMLIYQFGFCAAAATIVSGAIGERMNFRAYMLISLLMAALIYPSFGHLVWGNVILADNPSFLADMGFKDYAGGTVVHVIGGAAALAACVFIGPRLGRFDKSGKPLSMPGHSSVLSLLGVIILAVSWIGFNAGSASPSSASFTQIIVNTVVAMCFGGAAALVYDLITNPRAMQPRTSASGILGGLVAITAGCAYVDFMGAVIIGFGGGLVATLGSEFLLKKAKVDDPVDAIATHLFAGIFGTLILAFFAQPEFVVGSRLSMFTTQAIGVAIAVAWSFGIMYGSLKIISMFMSVRVSQEEEEIGLNLVEHNASFDAEQLVSLIRDAKKNEMPLPAIATEVISEQPQHEGEHDFSVIGTMLTANKAAKEKLAEKTQQFDDYEKVGTDWLWETDADLNITFISKKFFTVFGDGVSAMIGKPYISFLRTYELSVEDHVRTLEAREIFDDVIFAVTGLDGNKRMFSMSGIPRFNGKGTFVGYRGRSLDISARLKADEEIRYLAHHDHLTGLANRNSFAKLAGEMFCDPSVSSHGAAVLSMDLDGFKAVNDSFGHHVGDELLKMVAERIVKIVGEDAVVARFGGDEFVVAIPLEPHSEHFLKSTTAALIESIGSNMEIDALQIRVGVSIGSACYPKNCVDLTSLIMFSDMALYEAKGKKTGQWVPFDNAMHERLKRRQLLENDMRAAIYSGQFYTLYQPQLDLVNKQLTGFEALVRWNHPELGELSPTEFIRIAEDTGLIADLGQMVLLEACKTAVHWPNINGNPLTISVNVSPQQFFNQDLEAQITKVLADTGLDPQRLEIEITEGTLVRDADEATKILTGLRTMGIRVAVDDFGTGYSSLSYLQKFPLDRLKIDRAFVKEIENSKNDQRITHAIVDLGRKLGLNVIAEGVETDGQFAKLAAMECHEMQGFLFSAPVSALQTMKLIDDAVIRGDGNRDDQVSNWQKAQ